MANVYSMSVNNPPAKTSLKVLHLLFGTDLVREQLADFQRYTLELRAWAKMLAAMGAIALALTLGYMLAQYPFCGASLVLVLPVFGYALLMCLALMEKTDGVLRTLNNTLDIRAISPLCEALEWRDNSVRRVARNTLPSLLTQLRATDSLLLTRIARDCLYRQLVIRSGRPARALAGCYFAGIGAGRGCAGRADCGAPCRRSPAHDCATARPSGGANVPALLTRPLRPPCGA